MVKMFNRNISQLIVTFAFFYSSLICHFKALEFIEENQNLMAAFLWFCSLTSFLGALRFQIAKLVKKLKEMKKK
ncbi:MAG: hypothetical protein CMP32_04265 [Rickettsiales bacterium]|nr:hypothetical protein [Rickettsiales bacterium]|tara:strand:- start:19 stop:240 length:222 start_codon:yes stop_codon:yes gene_type:complete